MNYVIVGLGNPGSEYARTRHNVGRMVVELLHDRSDATDWRVDRTLRARVSTGVLGPQDREVEYILPDNYMNRSGGSVAPRIGTIEQAERLIVVHDDIDLPFGEIKIVFDRGAGGHNGVRSIERSLHTRAFTRVRVGVVPVTPSGELKKPKGEAAINDFILRPMTPREEELLAPVVTRAADAVLCVVTEGRERAMCAVNGAGGADSAGGTQTA